MMRAPQSTAVLTSAPLSLDASPRFFASHNVVAAVALVPMVVMCSILALGAAPSIPALSKV